MGRWPGRGVLLVLVGALFVVAVTVAATTEPQVARAPAPPVERVQARPSPAQASTTSERTPRPESLRSDRPPLRPYGSILLGLCLLAVLLIGGVMVAMLWQSLRGRVTLRQRPPSPVSEPDKEEAKEQVRAAVAASIDELTVEGSDPRSAVIGCWLRLEQAAAAAGTGRKPSDTPGELVARMLAEHQVSEPVLDRFAAVYRRARYAPHEIDESMREEARAALQRVHADLSRPASGVFQDGTVRA